METLITTDHVSVKLPPVVSRAQAIADKADKTLVIVSRHRMFATVHSGMCKFYLPCPCGNFGNLSMAACNCTVEEITDWQRTMKNDNASGIVFVEGYLRWSDFVFDKNFTEAALLLFKQAYTELSLTANNVVDMSDCAAIIANMDDSAKIDACHIAEAISYRLH